MGSIKNGKITYVLNLQARRLFEKMEASDENIETHRSFTHRFTPNNLNKTYKVSWRMGLQSVTTKLRIYYNVYIYINVY